MGGLIGEAGSGVHGWRHKDHDRGRRKGDQDPDGGHDLDHHRHLAGVAEQHPPQHAVL